MTVSILLPSRNLDQTLDVGVVDRQNAGTNLIILLCIRLFNCVSG